MTQSRRLNPAALIILAHKVNKLIETINKVISWG